MLSALSPHCSVLAKVPYQSATRLGACSHAPVECRGFSQGRHYEQLVDASALRADEGRGIAAISAGEPCAGFDPAISEWGNPLVFHEHHVSITWRAPGELKHLMYPEEQTASP